MSLFTVIEPHADDACLSLHEHITEWRAHGHGVRIVTVFADRRRATEGRVYAGSVGAAYTCLSLPSGTTEDVLSLRLSEVLDEGSSTRFFGPLGLRHAEHQQVARALAGLECCAGVLYRYVEQPYALKYVNEMELDTAAGGLTVVSLRLSTKKKWAVFPATFRSQSLFWRNEGPLCEQSRAWELVLE